MGDAANKAVRVPDYGRWEGVSAARFYACLQPQTVKRLRPEKRPMPVKLRDVKTCVIKERNGSYAVACSALGVYSVGKTLLDARSNFEKALELHLSALREKAVQPLAA